MKKILLILLTFLTVTSFAQLANPGDTTGTLVTSSIRPNSQLDNIATAYTNEVRGGIHNYDTWEELQAVKSSRLVPGMLASVADSSYKVFQYNGTSWNQFSVGSTEGGVGEAPINGERYVRVDGGWDTALVVTGTGLERISESTGADGLVIIDRDPDKYGPIGDEAVDLSSNNYTSSTRGATGGYSLAANESTTASGRSSAAFNVYSQATGLGSFAAVKGYAYNDNAVAIGYEVQADQPNQTVFGKNFWSTIPGSIFEIGIGDVDSKSAFRVYDDGRVLAPELTLAKILDPQSLTTKEYVDNNSGGDGIGEAPTNGLLYGRTNATWDTINGLEKIGNSWRLIGETPTLIDGYTHLNDLEVDGKIRFPAEVLIGRNIFSEGTVNPSNADVYIGYSVAKRLNSGNSNTVVGGYSFYESTSGMLNSIFGGSAMRYSNGDKNTALGYSAGQKVKSGTYNSTTNEGVYIGHWVRSFANNQTNEIVIGSLANGNGSHTATIGDDRVTDLYANEEGNADVHGKGFQFKDGTYQNTASTGGDGGVSFSYTIEAVSPTGDAAAGEVRINSATPSSMTRISVAKRDLRNIASNSIASDAENMFITRTNGNIYSYVVTSITEETDSYTFGIFPQGGNAVSFTVGEDVNISYYTGPQTVVAGDWLTGGGSGSSITINFDTTKVVAATNRLSLEILPDRVFYLSGYPGTFSQFAKALGVEIRDYDGTIITPTDGIITFENAVNCSGATSINQSPIQITVDAGSYENSGATYASIDVVFTRTSDGVVGRATFFVRHEGFPTF